MSSAGSHKNKNHNHSHSHGQDMTCPDPSVHIKHDRLSAQASTAALYVTQPHKGTDPRQPAEDVLGKDGKLSSKGAATSLKYAKATDLPSFPSHGGQSNAAGAAAMLAKDYKMKDLWQPEQSSAGSKAAMQAHKDGGKLDLWQYEGSKNGLSAATLAMRKNTQSPLSPNIDRGYTDAGKSNSLLAATKSTKATRQRAGSTPVPPPALYPDEKNSARNALSAATVSHRKSVRASPTKPEEGYNSTANQAARFQNNHMDPAMFGSSPPVEPELEEKRREDALRASAVSMAKKMYDVQNRAMLATASDNSSIGSAGAETAHRRNASAISQPNLKEEAMKYITLQDQAHKLAQERLAKVDKDMENSKYREYYGYGDKRKSRLSVRGRTRNRASSEGGGNSSDSDDEQQARHIRSQMTQLSTAKDTVSDKQRDDDRARLLKAAEKRVHDRMHAMDEKVFTETGKPSQAMMDDWEAKAREKAEKDRSEREAHPGKTHIGGGKYMDQSEIEAIAAARLKPTLDELDDTATKKREHDIEMAKRRDDEHTRQMNEKMRNEEQKAEFKKIKEQDKAAARREKEERKAAQREEKTRKSEDARKSREVRRSASTTSAGGAAAVPEQQEPKEEQQTDPKNKRKSVFGRFTDKFKKDDKPANTDRPATADRQEVNNKVIGAPAAGVAGSAGAADAPNDDEALQALSSQDGGHSKELDSESTKDVRSTSVERSVAADESERKASVATTEPERKDDTFIKNSAAAATGGAGAGGLAWATSNFKDGREEREEGSSLSTSDRDGDSLQQVETAHSLQPLQSPDIEKRPDLERHISAIPDSSGEESESDELSDSDDEDDYGGRREGAGGFTSTKAEQAPVIQDPAQDKGALQHIDSSDWGAGTAAAVGAAGTAGAAGYGASKGEDTTMDNTRSVLSPETQKYSRAHPLDGTETKGIEAPATKPATSSTQPTPAAEPAPAENERLGATAVSAPPQEVTSTKEEAKPTSSSTKPEPAAEAPTVATGPSTTFKETASTEKPTTAEKEKEAKSGGLRGLFSRFKGRDRGDSGSSGKLQKSRSPESPTTQSSDKGFQGGAKYTPPSTSSRQPDEASSTVTTSASKDTTAAAAAPTHVGIDDPIGQPGTTGARDGSASPSSFRRGGTEGKALSEVSSSGAEEEDVVRGRSGRSASARNTGVGAGKGSVGGEGRESEEQFEEARDHFDESLAPPAAFAGSAKNGGSGTGSPVRETKFVERF